jgi:parvulin-like peptidyl-prolyl isomerase
VDEQSAVNGGDLGWNTREAYLPEFSEAAFTLEPGETSEPVQTQFGWHIITMIEREEDRPLTIQALNQQKQAVFQTWLDQQREEADIETDVVLPRDQPQAPPGFPPQGPPIGG